MKTKRARSSPFPLAHKSVLVGALLLVLLPTAGAQTFAVTAFTNLSFADGSTFVGAAISGLDPGIFEGSSTLFIAGAPLYNNLPCGTANGTTLIFTDCIAGGGHQVSLTFAGPFSAAAGAIYSVTGTLTYPLPDGTIRSVPVAAGQQIGISLFPTCPAGQSGTPPNCTGTPLQITTASLPNAISGQSYSTTLAAIGGTEMDYQWAIIAGIPPNGFNLTKEGVLNSNSVALSAQSYTFIVSVTDSARNVAIRQFTLTVQPTTPPSLSITLVDPISEPSLLDGNRITEAATAADVQDQEPYLADLSKGRPVLGVASDGVAQVVLRIMASSVGEQFTLDLSNQCTGLNTFACIDEYGLLFDPTHPTDPPDGIFGDSSGSTQSVISVPTDHGAMAFAVYRAPLDFVRSENDQSASSRTVTVKVTSSLTGAQPALNIIVVRPPLFLIHGIFSSPAVFNQLIPVINNPSNPLFYLQTLAYSDDIDSEVTSVDPATIRTSKPVLRNVVGVEYNAPLLLEEMLDKFDAFRDIGPFPNQVPIPVAAVQADIVAHSLGGLMARGMSHVGTDYPLTPESQAAFYDDESYGRGYIHKLITLGTPHLGTNSALRLVNGDVNPSDPRIGELFANVGGNDCTRKQLGGFGEYNFKSITINGITYDGAAYDLYGDPTQGIKSPTLTLLGQANILPIPTGLIAANFNEDNDDNTDLTIAGDAARYFCGTKTVTQESPTTIAIHYTGVTEPSCAGVNNCRIVYGDFLADHYYFDHWADIFNGEPSDALVPVISATYGRDILPFNGVVHGPGTVGLAEPVFSWLPIDPHVGFAGPQLLDPPSAYPNPKASVPVRILQLLNTSIADKSNFVDVP